LNPAQIKLFLLNWLIDNIIPVLVVFICEIKYGGDEVFTIKYIGEDPKTEEKIN